MLKMQFVCISSMSAEYLHKILRGCVHDEKQLTKNRALGNTTWRYTRTRKCYYV